MKRTLGDMNKKLAHVNNKMETMVQKLDRAALEREEILEKIKYEKRQACYDAQHNTLLDIERFIQNAHIWRLPPLYNRDPVLPPDNDRPMINVCIDHMDVMCEILSYLGMCEMSSMCRVSRQFNQVTLAGFLSCAPGLIERAGKHLRGEPVEFHIESVRACNEILAAYRPPKDAGEVYVPPSVPLSKIMALVYHACRTFLLQGGRRREIAPEDRNLCHLSYCYVRDHDEHNGFVYAPLLNLYTSSRFDIVAAKLRAAWKSKYGDSDIGVLDRDVGGDGLPILQYFTYDNLNDMAFKRVGTKYGGSNTFNPDEAFIITDDKQILPLIDTRFTLFRVSTAPYRDNMDDAPPFDHYEWRIASRNHYVDYDTVYIHNQPPPMPLVTHIKRVQAALCGGDNGEKDDADAVVLVD